VSTDSMHVLSTMSFPDHLLERLRSVSPSLMIKQHSAALAEGIPRQLWDRVEVLYTMSAIPDQELVPRLRWVQSHSAGVNHMLNNWVWESDVIITTTSGIHAPNMAEYVLMMMLAFAHRLPRMLAHQARAEWPSGRWQKFAPQELRGATVGVVGYGSIGREVGRLAHAFGMRVLGVRRGPHGRPADYELPELAPVDQPDLLISPDRLIEILPECDYIALSVPYTAATHHLINRITLRAMKPTAMLINVARGAVVNQPALTVALQEGWIAGAALDVFEQEPLPADSPLWGMDNVIISPHIAGFTPHYDERAVALFAENLRRYLTGQPLHNLVDRGREY